MKLSEAILEGCKSTEQISCWFRHLKEEVEPLYPDFSYKDDDIEAPTMDYKIITRWTRACALGAALISVESDAHKLQSKIKGVGGALLLATKEFPILSIKYSNVPEELLAKLPRSFHLIKDKRKSDFSQITLGNLIMFLNDNVNMTREDIASWVYLVEKHFDKENLKKAEEKAQGIVTENNEKLQEEKEKVYVI